MREKNLLAKLLPCVFGERDFVSYGEVLRYVVVKGDNCFIFTEENDPSPLYAIALHDKTAKREDPNNPEGTSLTISPTFKNIAKDDLETVLLKYRGSGKVAYQFTFNKRDGCNLVDGFLGVVDSLSKSSGKAGDRVSLLNTGYGSTPIILGDIAKIPRRWPDFSHQKQSELKVLACELVPLLTFFLFALHQCASTCI